MSFALRATAWHGWGMLVAAVALWSLSVFGPPVLPPDIGDLPPTQDVEPPSEDAAPPSEDAAPPAEDVSPPSEDVNTAEADDAGAPEQPLEDEPIEVEPDDEPAAPEDPAPTTDAVEVAPSDAGAGPAVQEPAVQTPVAPAAVAPAPTPPTSSVEGPAPAAEPDSAAVEPEPEADPPEEQSFRPLGGVRLIRLGLAARVGYTHGTSAKNGLFDRDKSIQDSVNNMMVTTSGAGDLGKTRFGGFDYGFILDAEVVGINVWLDFHKFFNPGGMWSLLLGYDHEFGFGKRLRLDVGVAGGLNHVFLGSVLEDLYYDKENPEAVNIGTLGVEGRGMVDLHIKLVGPLYTGPYALIGYHYLWSANVEEVTAEKGLHYSAGWSLRLDFAAPKLLGGRKKKPAASTAPTE
ncbi:hypothetical protein [Enhygromyxa salina]|uniref:Uncharacterized protein n=1 Tax=Enhygromyxa salina TaxID=215803 RepID=A0A2S9YI77_9BACT|nr:hypothetical protein [Enhygromyxa salina]PRQ04814.1 hypothetical protein ENSA7_49870 [Enhygromyxa salina]